MLLLTNSGFCIVNNDTKYILLQGFSIGKDPILESDSIFIICPNGQVLDNFPGASILKSETENFKKGIINEELQILINQLEFLIDPS